MPDPTPAALLRRCSGGLLFLALALAPGPAMAAAGAGCESAAARTERVATAPRPALRHAAPRRAEVAPRPRPRPAVPTVQRPQTAMPGTCGNPRQATPPVPAMTNAMATTSFPPGSSPRMSPMTPDGPIPSWIGAASTVASAGSPGAGNAPPPSAPPPGKRSPAPASPEPSFGEYLATLALSGPGLDRDLGGVPFRTPATVPDEAPRGGSQGPAAQVTAVDAPGGPALFAGALLVLAGLRRRGRDAGQRGA